jgi:hypothetical protein
MAGDGGVHLFWTTAPGALRHRFMTGGQWSDAATIDASGASDPTAGRGRDGRPLVVWSDLVAGQNWDIAASQLTGLPQVSTPSPTHTATTSTPLATTPVATTPIATTPIATTPIATTPVTPSGSDTPTRTPRVQHSPTPTNGVPHFTPTSRPPGPRLYLPLAVHTT